MTASAPGRITGVSAVAVATAVCTHALRFVLWAGVGFFAAIGLVSALAGATLAIVVAVR